MALRTLTGEKLEAERARLALMREYEDTYAACTAICGIDEAGRGPLAGPVVAGAVILPKDCEILGLNDSKKLSEKKREALLEPVKATALGFGIGQASWEEIDQLNILQATFLAMRRAVEQMEQQFHLTPDLVLVDGNRDPHLGLQTRTVVKGDGTSACIAAASILAKVTRDRQMVELDRQYPQYGFAKHKGYPTKQHYACIEQYGISQVHRRSFLKKLLQD